MADAVRVLEPQNVSAAWIAARRGVGAATIGTAIGMAMPGARAWTGDDAAAMMAVGPGTWLAQRRDAPPAWCRDLETRLAGLASVSDLTGAWRLFRIEGSGARTLLQRGMNVDLHDSEFPPGSVAATAIAHLDVLVRCVEAGEVYEVAVYRSYAESFLRWIEATTAGIGS